MLNFDFIQKFKEIVGAVSSLFSLVNYQSANLVQLGPRPELPFTIKCKRVNLILSL